MGPAPRWTVLLACAALTLGALVSSGCGDDEEPSGEPPGSDRSDPALHSGTGSPDGGTAVKSAKELLATLHARVADGRGLADAAFERDVQSVAAVLWDLAAGGHSPAPAQVHVQISSVAAEVGAWLAASETARAEREKSHPVDVQIHDAFLEAASCGPEAYRTWCGDAGAALLKQLGAARRARFFPPK